MKVKTMLRFVNILTLIFVIVCFSKQSFAETGSAPTATTNPKKATLNFEDELVQGGTQKPELFYLFQKKNFNYKRLIKLRENFLPEMRRTTEDIQRVRGAN